MTELPAVISSPDHPALETLRGQLAQQSAALDGGTNGASGGWPGEQLALCGDCGVFQWFLPEAWGGQAWSERDLMRAYLRLSGACLTTTFVITQLTGASRRIAASQNDELKAQLLPALARGEKLSTLAISHLTTSRRHLAKPVLRARPDRGDYILDGFSPWVTGAGHADFAVTGATMDDGRQILVALPLDLAGVAVPEPASLIGLSASHTGQVQLRSVRVSRDHLVDGPARDVMKRGTGAKTGGLQTSTLAAGLATAAADWLAAEAARRAELARPAQRLQADCRQLTGDLLATAAGQQVSSNEELRVRANSLVLRATQAALAAAKGTGYVVGHPAGRWCREALFFLVWSCPQPVVAASLCELAGISD